MKSIDVIENLLSSRTNLITRYAFSVIMTEEDYEKLTKACLYDNDFLDNPIMYPWCHTKLLTETYLRIIHDKKINDHHTSEEIKNSLGIFNDDKFDKLWKRFPTSLSKINLERKRKEGGPWHIVANIRLHAGIPQSRLDELVCYLKKKYKRHLNVNDTLTYLFSYDSVIRNMHLSKWVKEAFEEERTRKMLFSWLLKLIDYDINYNINDLRGSSEIPPHLIQYFIKNQDYTQNHIVLSENKKQEKYEGLYYNEENYNLYLKLLGSNVKKINNYLPQYIKKQLNVVSIGDDIIYNLRITPDDFPLNFIYRTGAKTRMKILTYFSKSVECLVFDSLGKTLFPVTSEILLSDKRVFILSKVRIHELGNEYQEMYDEWWGWFFYSIDFDVDINLSEPYGRVSFKFSGIIENKIHWLSNPITQIDSLCPLYGGNNIPKFSISSRKDDFNPGIICFEIRNTTETIIKTRAVYKYNEENDVWIWEPPETTLPDGEYYLNISQYKFQFESEPLIELHCIWLKGFRYTLNPSTAIFPKEKCIIKLEGLKNNEIRWNTSEANCNKNEPTEYTFLKKPEDTSPSINIKTLKGWCNLMIKLNYVTCYIEYGDISEQRVKLDILEKYISNETLKNIVEIDDQAHIIICCPKITARLFLLSGEEKIKEISLNKTYSDAILLNELSIYNKEIYLVNGSNEDKVIIISHNEYWRYKDINKKLKKELIYKNSFFGGREYD